MQMDPAAERTSTTFPQAQPTWQAAANIDMKFPPTAKESVCPLQRGINCFFVDSVSHSSFLNTRILQWELLQVMLNERHVLVGLELVNRGQTSVDEVVQTISGFGCRTY